MGELCGNNSETGPRAARGNASRRYPASIVETIQVSDRDALYVEVRAIPDIGIETFEQAEGRLWGPCFVSDQAVRYL